MDLDVRFKIGNLDFNTCRDIVEGYLLQKLNTEEAEAEINPLS